MKRRGKNKSSSSKKAVWDRWAASYDPSNEPEDDTWLHETAADFSATRALGEELAASYSSTGAWPEEVLDVAKRRGMPEDTAQDNEDYFASRITMTSSSGIAMSRLRWSWSVCGRPVVAPSIPFR